MSESGDDVGVVQRDVGAERGQLLPGVLRASDEPVLLLNDAGTAWISGLRGSCGDLQNSQCTINSASTLTGTGNADLNLR